LPIDLKSTIACLSDPSGGLKAYSYAGIKIRNHNLQKELYEEIRDQIIRLLLDIKDPITSKTIVEWVVKREELYSGPYLYKYPDVLFKLKNNWGVGWDINKDLFGKSFSHRIHSGNHRQDTPVFLIYDCNKVHTTTSNATLMDIAPTIFSLLGIKGEFAFDGKSIIAE
jgi:predicted AlkP superfamily phosphohydrolase/phosphomutase